MSIFTKCDILTNLPILDQLFLIGPLFHCSIVKNDNMPLNWISRPFCFWIVTYDMGKLIGFLGLSWKNATSFGLIDQVVSFFSFQISYKNAFFDQFLSSSSSVLWSSTDKDSNLRPLGNLLLSRTKLLCK